MKNQSSFPLMLALLRSSGRWSRLLFLTVVSAGALQAQPVPKAVLVEQFTNTVCSICASRNPGFHTNLRQNPGSLHIAYHPSSPYRSCLFSQQNTAENDARTNFYGVYGGTPRLVLNGSVIPAGQDYSSAALFAPFQGQTSPFAVAVSLRATGPDSITATVRLTTRAAHSYPALTVYVALVEDTIQYRGSNGEPTHYNVFRRSFSGTNAVAIVPAPTVGGVVTVSRTIFKTPIWTARRLYALAVVQDSGRQVVQAGISPHFNSVVSGLRSGILEGLQVYPNPTQGTLLLDGATDLPGGQVVIYNMLGQVVLREKLGNAPASLDVKKLAAGAYFLQATTATGRHYATRFAKAE